MADTDKVSLEKNALNDLGTLSAASNKDGETVQFDGDNEKMVFICKNDDDADDVHITFHSGDRWQSSIGNLGSGSIATGDYAAFVLETARFKNADGELEFDLGDSAGGASWTGDVGNFLYDLLELP